MSYDHGGAERFGQVTGIEMPVDKMRDVNGDIIPTGPDGKPWPATVLRSVSKFWYVFKPYNSTEGKTEG